MPGMARPAHAALPVTMAADAAVADGRRGFRTGAPPPQGCVGWTRAADEDAVKAEEEGGAVDMLKTEEDKILEDPAEGAAAEDAGEGAAAEAPAGDAPTAEAAVADQTPDAADVRDPFASGPLGPLQSKAHLDAIVNCDLDVLKETDSNLQGTLAEDEGVLDHEPRAADALKLYRATLAACYDDHELEKAAFAAVMRDDPVRLRELLDTGALPRDLKNGGGQTLLDVAQERRKQRVEQMLLGKDEVEPQGPEISPDEGERQAGEPAGEKASPPGDSQSAEPDDAS